MSAPDEYFNRIAGSVNLALLQSELVVVVGIGTVGSQIAYELARCGVSRFRLIDGDHLEETNRPRHVLPARYVGVNKAEALTLYLHEEIPRSQPFAVPRYINNDLPDNQLDALLAGAGLIVAATDDREAQRRVGRRALALSIPAIFPALYGSEGGEVIVQLDSRFPCFFCWDGFRTNAEQLRGVNALNVDTLPVIYTAIKLGLGILDPRSEHRHMMMTERSEPPNQVFVQEPSAELRMAPLTRRPDCPSCAVGPPLGVPWQPPPPPVPVPVGPRYGVIALIVVAALLLIVVLAISHHSTPATPSASSPPLTQSDSETTSEPETTSTSESQTTSTTESPTATCSTPAQCLEEGANAASGESGTTSTSAPPPPGSGAQQSPETGTSEATALAIEPGAEESGNSGTVAYGEGSCGPEQGQFWQAALTQGDTVTIVWGGPNGSAMGLDIWPPGTTDIHGSDERRVTYASTEGDPTETTFTVPSTGVYPIVVDDSCGQAGPFHFTLTTHSN